MLFNSPEFLLFLPIVFGLYWFVTQRNLKAQNLLLLVASYVFYGWWDWRFLGLIALSTIVDFLVGIRIEEAPDKPRETVAVGLPRRQPRHPRLLQVRQLLHRELDLGLAGPRSGGIAGLSNPPS